MRSLVISVLAITLSACSGMMLGGGSPGSTPAAKDRPSGAKQASDAAINSRLRAQSAADPGLAKFAIGVSTAAGFVTLSGKVATYAARETAEKLAMATDGVKAVDNQISVSYAQ
jgi:osmotically-inducible protein OsmY